MFEVRGALPGAELGDENFGHELALGLIYIYLLEARPELVYRHHAAALGASDGDARIHCQQNGRSVRRGRGVADVARHGALAPDLVGAHVVRGFRNCGHLLLHYG